MKDNRALRTAWIASIVILYLFWGITELVITPAVGGEALEIIKETAGKLLVWALPAWLLMRRFDGEVHVPCREAFRPKREWLAWLCGAALVMLVVHIGIRLRSGGTLLAVNPEFRLYQIISVLCIGLGEELFFRGWLLGAAFEGNTKREWLYVAVNALLFLCIHFPIWIRTGVFVSYLTSLAFLQIIALSFVFSYSYLRTRSLAVPVLLHAWWDLLCYLQ